MLLREVDYTLYLTHGDFNYSYYYFFFTTSPKRCVVIIKKGEFGTLVL